MAFTWAGPLSWFGSEIDVSVETPFVVVDFGMRRAVSVWCWLFTEACLGCWENEKGNVAHAYVPLVDVYVSQWFYLRSVQLHSYSVEFTRSLILIVCGMSSTTSYCAMDAVPGLEVSGLQVDKLTTRALVKTTLKRSRVDTRKGNV